MLGVIFGADGFVANDYFCRSFIKPLISYERNLMQQHTMMICGGFFTRVQRRGGLSYAKVTVYLKANAQIEGINI